MNALSGLAQESEMGRQTGMANRLRLAYRWIPAGADRLLDAGCAAGRGTAHYARKARETWGIDPSLEAILTARRRFPHIHFEHSVLEKLPFDSNFFDVVIVTDVLEHVQSETAALNEIYRVTRPGATIIITTPHTGWFAWFDPYNYGSLLRKRLPGAYRFLKTAGLATSSSDSVPEHRHYSVADLERLLQQSDFKSKYSVAKVFLSGCFLFPLEINVIEGLSRLLPLRVAEILSTPFRWLSEIDYWIPFGSSAYNVAICIKRN